MNKQESMRGRMITRRALGIYMVLVGLGLLLTGAARTCAAPAEGPTSAAAATPTPPLPLAELRGVRLGMTEAEVHAALDHPSSNTNSQSRFLEDGSESVTVSYDAARRVQAMTFMFTHEATNIPVPRAILGEDLTPGADGAMHKLIRHPQHGHWVAYTRTGGGGPVTIITMGRIPPGTSPAVGTGRPAGCKPLMWLDAERLPQPPFGDRKSRRDTAT